MPDTRRGIVAGLLALAAAAQAAAQQPTRPEFRSIQEAVAASAQLAGSPGPRSVNWIDNGTRFAYTSTDPATRRETIKRYDPRTLREDVLLDTRELLLPGADQPLSYRSFQWAKDGRTLLFQTNFRPIFRVSGLADFYLYSFTDKSLQLVARDARTAELSPDGGRVGLERGGDVYVYDLAGKTEKRLTTGGSDSIFNGAVDWVYEEEFGIGQAWKWSPDSRHIAFWHTDDRPVPTLQLTDYQGKWPSWMKVRYPKVGDSNPKVRIGVADVVSGQTVWLDTKGGEEEEYVPRIYWTSDPNLLAVLTQNRRQNDARVYLYDTRDGSRKLVLEEKSDTYVDIFEFFAGVQDFLFFPAGVREFFWLSDRDGHQHLYRYDYDGKLLNQVTKGPFMVTRVDGIDARAKTIYYSSTEVSPLERHLYRVRFDGKGKQRLSEASGNHRFNMSPAGNYYIDSWSSTQQPRQVELWSTAPRKLATLENNAAVTRWLAGHAYAPVELFRFTTTDGVTLDGSMIKPPDFDATKKYPVILSIYGGPGSQQVYNQFATSGWDQYLAQQGFIIVGLNNRGSGNYSRDFQKQVYRQLGKWEANDFAEVGRWLAQQPYVAGDHLAIHGTSYGGYMTVYTMEMHPDVFRAGIANSPGTDWRLYDTVYSEHYMGLLSDNEAGYRASSAVENAGKLKGYLLLVHSGLDENVHPQQTMQLLTALLEAGKDAELRFFPPGAHGAAFDTPSYMTMLKVYANTWCEQVALSCRPANLNQGNEPIF